MILKSKRRWPVGPRITVSPRAIDLRPGAAVECGYNTFARVYFHIAEVPTCQPTFFLLCSWTQQGIEKIKESPKRLDAAKTLFRELGAEIKSFHMTAGRYDIAILVDAKDEASLAKTVLTQASKGGLRTETLRAFTEEEYRKIIASLP